MISSDRGYPDLTCLRQAVDASGEVIFMTDREGVFTFVNARFEQVYGYTAAEVIGRTTPRILQGGHVPRERYADLWARLLHGESVSYLFANRTKDGRLIDIEATVSPARDEDGALVGFLAIQRDITERKRTEEDIRESELRYRSLFDNMLNGVATIRLIFEGEYLADFEYLAVNRMFETLTGLSNVIGRRVTEVIPGIRTADPQLFERYGRVARTAVPEQFEIRVEALKAWFFISVYRHTADQLVVVFDVITDRKQAEEGQRFQHTVLETVRELTLDGILVVDEHSKILSLNQRFCDMWGIQADMVGARADDELLKAVLDKLPDPQRFMARVRELYARHDETSRDEVTLTDGRIFDRYSAPMRNPEGRYYGRVWYFRDVTAGRLAAAALRQERDRADRYFEVADVMLLALDLEGRIMRINRKGCAILEWEEHELFGRPWVDTCIPERIRPALVEKLKRLQSGDLSLGENPILTRSGSERLIAWRNTVLRDDAGHVTATLSSGEDVTDRRRAAIALAESQARLQLISDNVLDLVAQIQIDGTYVYVSPSYRLILGHEEEALVGRSALALVHPEDLPQVAAILRETIHSRTTGRAEFRYRHAGGHYVWLETVGKVLLEADGEPIGLILSSRDLTERKRHEDMLRQSQKLEAIGSLAGGIAHDFNNLLTSILGYTDLAISEVAPDHPVQPDLEEINRAARSAEALTRQLLIFSRKSVAQPVHLHINDVVPQLEKMLRRMVGEHVAFDARLGEGMGFVKIDAGQLEQVVMNLVVNARDAMPRGGDLTISTRAVTEKDGTFDALTVTDTGCGMSPEVRAKIFEPFFTTKSADKGTGLGLATVQRIVAGAGGRISVESTVGSGSAFTILLPRVAEHGAGVPGGAAPLGPMPTGTETVLFVEDSESIRTMAARALTGLGYAVLPARDGADAMQRAPRRPEGLDLLVTDVVMPGMNGPALVRQLREVQSDVKVIFTSGFVGDAELLGEIQATGAPFLRKPYTVDALARAIRRVLDA